MIRVLDEKSSQKFFPAAHSFSSSLCSLTFFERSVKVKTAFGARTAPPDVAEKTEIYILTALKFYVSLK